MDSKNTLERTRQWIQDDPDSNTAAELQQLLDDGGENALRDLDERMAGPLAFGTAGLRGVIGAGESRMNRAVILRTTAGLARYLLDTIPDAATKGVVIGYDGRRMSDVFARDAAETLAGAGIKALLFDKLVPTPLVAFAVNDFEAAAGIMVTASHNPPEYNGYKVYWSNGAQIIPPHDRGIAAAIDATGPARLVPRLTREEAASKGLFSSIPDDLGSRDLESVSSLATSQHDRDEIRIVYSAMHGVGDPWAAAALERFGFENVWSVAEQRDPDGEFPTVRFPNPEEKGAIDLSLRLASRENANLILVNDPDADRLSVAIPTKAGQYRQLTGNEVGILFGEYLLRTAPDQDSQPLVMTTIVSTPGLAAIAAALGARYEETLTGFKWIATRALELEAGASDGDDKPLRFLFGFEEALGYTIGRAVRDKDGISAAALFAELAACAAAEGRTVEDELARVAREHGLFVSQQRSIVKKGREGAAAIVAMMDALRKSSPKEIGDAKVLSVRDYLESVNDLPKSNVIAFDIEGGSRVVVRPSGTEPKIKFYFDHREQVSDEESYDHARQRGLDRIDALADAIFAHLET